MIGVILFLIVSIFLLDMMTSLGVTLSILYVVPVYLASWTRQQRIILSVATGCTVLTISGYFFSPSGGLPRIAVINHFLAIVAILCTAVLSIRHNQLSDEIKTLRGLLKICASCNQILNEKGEWEKLEVYIGTRTEAALTHGICPRCREEYREKLVAEEHHVSANQP